MNQVIHLPTNTRPSLARGLYPTTQPASLATCYRQALGRPILSGGSSKHKSTTPCGQLAAPGPRHMAVAPARAFPFDLAWSPNLDSNAIAPQLFAFSLFPYLAFLFFLTKSGKAPKLTLAGFWFLLVFVGATIPAGIYAKLQYGTALANVDWLHGSAESLLTVTNLLIVVGLRQGIREHEEKAKQSVKDDGQP